MPIKTIFDLISQGNLQQPSGGLPPLAQLPQLSGSLRPQTTAPGFLPDLALNRLQQVPQQAPQQQGNALQNILSNPDLLTGIVALLSTILGGKYGGFAGQGALQSRQQQIENQRQQEQLGLQREASERAGRGEERETERLGFEKTRIAESTKHYEEEVRRWNLQWERGNKQAALETLKNIAMGEIVQNPEATVEDLQKKLNPEGDSEKNGIIARAYSDAVASSPDQKSRAAKRILGRELTDEEKQRLLGVAPPVTERQTRPAMLVLQDERTRLEAEVADKKTTPERRKDIARRIREIDASLASNAGGISENSRRILGRELRQLQQKLAALEGQLSDPLAGQMDFRRPGMRAAMEAERTAIREQISDLMEQLGIKAPPAPPPTPQQTGGLSQKIGEYVREAAKLPEATANQQIDAAVAQGALTLSEAQQVKAGAAAIRKRGKSVQIPVQ